MEMNCFLKRLLLFLSVLLCLSGCGHAATDTRNTDNDSVSEETPKGGRKATISGDKTSGGYDIFVKPDTSAMDVWYDSVGNQVEVNSTFLSNAGSILVDARDGEERKVLRVPCTVGELADRGFTVKEDLETVTTGEHGIDLFSGGPEAYVEIDCKVNNYKNGSYEPIGEDKLGNCIVTSITSKRGAGHVEFYGGMTADTTVEEAMAILGADTRPEHRFVCLTRYPDETLTDGIYYIKNESGAGVYRFSYEYNFYGDMSRLQEQTWEEANGAEVSGQSQASNQPEVSGQAEASNQTEVSNQSGDSPEAETESSESAADTKTQEALPEDDGTAPIFFTDDGKINFRLQKGSGIITVGEVTLGEFKEQMDLDGYQTILMAAATGLHSTMFQTVGETAAIGDSVTADTMGDSDDEIVFAVNINFDENYGQFQVAGFDQAETSEEEIIKAMGEPNQAAPDAGGVVSYIWRQDNGYIRIRTCEGRIQHIYMVYGEY